MPAVVMATITRVITQGYAEAVLWENGEPGKERCVAENLEKAKRGDVVELKPAKPWKKARGEWLPYLVVPLFFVIGMLLERGGAGAEHLLSGGILALLGFLLIWLTTRRTRMRRAMRYEVVCIVQKARDPWLGEQGEK
jgi:hypothetical protein